MPPLFVTFEGLDGSGKSTHLRRAAAFLDAAGHAVRVTHEPGGTALGEAIRGLFLDRRFAGLDGGVEAMLVFASRRQHLLEVIDPALAAGQHVLCDRFTDSTAAYQGSGRGLDRGAIAALDRLATAARRPDLTLLFDLPAAVARSRGQSHRRRAAPAGLDRLDGEELAFYQRVRDGFLGLAAAEPERFRIVDSSGDAEDTWRQVEAILESTFGSRGRR